MASLSGSLTIATRALLAEEGAMQAATNNLANINTPGYSRQVPILQASDPIVSGTITYGNGVVLEGFQSLRDHILDLRIDEEQQNQGKYDSFCSAMEQLQTLFSDPAGGVGGAITSFFNSVSQLSVQADSTSLREALLSAASALTTSFHSVATSLSTMSGSLDLQVRQSVDDINQLTTQIASLNDRISTMEKVGADGGTLLDQREQAISALSTMVDVSVTRTEDSLTLSTANGAALVVGGQSFALTTSVDPSTGHTDVISSGCDITDSICRGELAGLIEVRDQEIPTLQASLDGLAARLSTSVNFTLASGKDRQGNAGAPLFTSPPANTAGAAALMDVAITDPQALALSSTGSAGGNDIVNSLLALRDEAIVDGKTPTNAYAELVFRLGSDLSTAKASQSTTSSILQQLRDQQGAISGVSVDEETANLMQFQRAFEAAAHVISVVDSMMKTVLAMGVTS